MRWPVLLLAALLGAAQPAGDSPPFVAADPDASPRITKLRADATNRRTVAAFWNDVRAAGAPIVEPSPRGAGYSLVTFVWRGTTKTRNVVIADGVAAGVGGADAAKSQMLHLAGTDVRDRTYELRNDARFTYKLGENDSLQPFTAPGRRSVSIVDPLNPRVFRTGHGIEPPDASAHFPGSSDAPLAGSVETARFVSASSGDQYSASVYLPPGFQRGPSYPLIVVLDGREYTTLIPGPAILDALIATGRIRPIVAVFVDTSFARSAQSSCSTAFGGVLADDLVPQTRARYRAGVEARETAIAGSSLGGLAAACAAVAHPGVFGNVLSQSGSYWWAPDAQAEWLTRRVRQTPGLRVRFFVEVGAMEIADQLDTNRRFRDALIASGAAVTYREFNGNHSYLPWRSGFAEGVVSLFGTAPR